MRPNNETGSAGDTDNLTDEEIGVLLTQEGDHIQRTASAALELLSNEWAILANLRAGDREEDLSDISQALADRATVLRKQFGYGSSGGVFSIGPIRKDGYSDDVASDQVENAGSEFEGSFEIIRPA